MMSGQQSANSEIDFARNLRISFDRANPPRFNFHIISGQTKSGEPRLVLVARLTSYANPVIFDALGCRHRGSGVADEAGKSQGALQVQ